MSVIPTICIGSDGGLVLSNSVRFRASAAPDFRYSNWTGSNRKTFTARFFVKRGLVGATERVLLAGYDGVSANAGKLLFDTSNRLAFRFGGAALNDVVTNNVFRDPTNHMDILLAVDTTQGTSTNRVKLYANGAQLTSLAAANYPSLNADCQFFINGLLTLIGVYTGSDYFDGVFSQIEIVMGAQLTPSSFGQTVNGVWVPSTYTGSYGTKGSKLTFSNTSSASALGTDSSGNGNNWTVTNVSVTSGITYDALIDTPSNNFCTLNSLTVGQNVSGGNLNVTSSTAWGTMNALAISSYWEVIAPGTSVTAGVITESFSSSTTTVTANKIFGFRLSSTGTLDYRNITDGGSWTNITSGLSGIQLPYVSGACSVNFGQRPFDGAVPGGYASLCSNNVAEGTITTSGSFTGNASTDGPIVFLNGDPQTMTINGNAVTWGTHAIKCANGFKVISNSASYNSGGSNNYSVSVTGAPFQRPNRAQSSP